MKDNLLEHINSDIYTCDYVYGKEISTYDNPSALKLFGNVLKSANWRNVEQGQQAHVAKVDLVPFLG